jgi:DNA-binding Lrp family transcriptional regulator
MSRAYVLISVKNPGEVRATADHLSKKKGVVSAEVIFGPYDIIAVIEGQDLRDLSSAVINDLYDLDHIQGSTTCIVTE